MHQARGALMCARTSESMPRRGFKAPMRDALSAETTNTGSISTMTHSSW